MANELSFGKRKLVITVDDPEQGREGTLHVRPGGITWFPKKKQKGLSLTWNRLNELAEGNPRKRKR